jgi:2-polyprenyl-3-methyl-5-hydroxy-6-metoxy-1,4-benzoquinol methylase
MARERSVAGSHAVTIEDIRRFWENFEYDDVRVVDSAPGSREYFADLSAIRARRMEYLARLADYAGYQGKQVLEVGCRIGLDLANFAKHGARVTGIEISRPALAMARTHFSVMGLEGRFIEMDGEDMEFADDTFDLVFAQGVVQYTAHPERMVRELHRVMKPGGAGFVMVYNRHSWLAALSRVSGKNLMHEEAPGFVSYSRREFRELLAPFSSVEIIPERFPVRTGLHQGGLSKIYYGAIVSLFGLLPRAWTGPLGAHLIARVRK